MTASLSSILMRINIVSIRRGSLERGKPKFDKHDAENNCLSPMEKTRREPINGTAGKNGRACVRA